jgi:hypothetical protein
MNDGETGKNGLTTAVCNVRQLQRAAPSVCCGNYGLLLTRREQDWKRAAIHQTRGPTCEQLAAQAASFGID